MCLSKLGVDPLQPGIDLVQALGGEADFVVEQAGDVIAVACAESSPAAARPPGVLRKALYSSRASVTR